MPRKKLLMVIVRRTTSVEVCGNCNNTLPDDTDYLKCPGCQAEFCGGCFTADPGGDGSTLICPHCDKKLTIPVKLRRAS